MHSSRSVIQFSCKKNDEGKPSGRRCLPSYSWATWPSILAITRPPLLFFALQMLLFMHLLLLFEYRLRALKFACKGRKREWKRKREHHRSSWRRVSIWEARSSSQEHERQEVLEQEWDIPIVSRSHFVEVLDWNRLRKSVSGTSCLLQHDFSDMKTLTIRRNSSNIKRAEIGEKRALTW